MTRDSWWCSTNNRLRRPSIEKRTPQAFRVTRWTYRDARVRTNAYDIEIATLSSRWRTWLPFLLPSCAVLLWAGNWAVGRALRFDAPPVAITFWRWLIAFLILLPITHSQLRLHRAIIVRSWKILCLLALSATVFQHIPIYIGLRSTTATNGALLNAMTPIFIIILLSMIGRDRMRSAALVGVVISLTGVVWIVSRGDLEDLRKLTINRGDIWVLVGTFACAAYTVCLRWRPATLPPLAFLTVIAGMGVVAITPLYAIEIMQVAWLKLNTATVLGIAYIGVGATVIAYIFWNRGVAQLGSGRTGPFIYRAAHCLSRGHVTAVAHCGRLNARSPGVF